MNFIIDTKGDDEINENFDKTGNEILETNSIVKQILTQYKEELSSSTSTPRIEIEKPLLIDQLECNENEQTDIIKKQVKDVLCKSVITPGFEQLHTVPTYEVSKRKQKKIKQLEKDKTKGKNWFNMPATEMTDEVKHDLEVLRMRSVIDPKHFYKKNDLKVLPKFFQIGKVMDSPLDYYNNRLTKKQRQKTLVDELLADANFNKYNKRKYKEIIEERQKTHYKAWRQARKLKRKNK